MAIYLLLAAPLVYLVVVDVVSRGELSFSGTDARTTLAPAVKGALSYIVVFLILVIVRDLMERQYTPGGLYLYHFLLDYAIPVGVGLPFLLLSLRQLKRESDRALLVAATGFFAGLFFVAAIADLVSAGRFLNPRVLFLLPTNRVVLMTVLPLLGIVFMREATTSRYLFLAGAVLLPAVVALPAMLFVLNYHIAAYLVTGVFAGLALLFYLATFVSYFGSDIGTGSRPSAGESRVSRSPRTASSVPASAPSGSGSEESE